MEADERYMRQALDLAREAARAGDHPFGSVIVAPGGEVVARGRNREVTSSDVTAHAEIEALRAATSTLGTTCLKGYTLYASGEPCVMCSFAIRQTGLSRVVYGAPSARNARVSPDPLCDPAFKTPPPMVESGILARESKSVQGRSDIP